MNFLRKVVKSKYSDLIKKMTHIRPEYINIYMNKRLKSTRKYIVCLSAKEK